MDLTDSRVVQLFSEATTSPDCLDMIIEQKDTSHPKKLKIKGPFIVCEKRNANGRLYKKNIMDAAVEEYYKDYILCGKSFGELGHPDRFEPSFEEACIRIESLVPDKSDSNVFIGEAVVMMSDPSHGIIGTKNGDVLASVIQYGGKPGVSTRALGEMTADKVIDSYLKLCAVDVVYNPSGPGCYVDGILESKEFLITAHGDIMEKAFQQLGESLSSIPSKERVEHLRVAFTNFLKNIK